MSIKSIRIYNLLSYEELIIDDIKDINCIVGKNNTGKSNLLKLIRFFYDKLDGKKVLPPTLNSNYSSFGTITIEYNLSRIKDIVTSKNRSKSKFFKYIYNILFKTENEKNNEPFFLELDKRTLRSTYNLTLKIHSNDATEWSTKDRKLLGIINYLYPFFEVETRHIDLYDWDKLWYVISKLKSFNVDNLGQQDIIDFFDTQLSEGSNTYNDYIRKIEKFTDTSQYSYREKVLNYVKVGLQGHTFTIDGEELDRQSDGTNSHKYIETFLNLLISLTRREYITPTVYIDEPETGLHPKRNEELINNLYEVYASFKGIEGKKEIGKYKTPYPTIIFSTHSPNIVKQVIKFFDQNQQILHFSKNKQSNTVVKRMNSCYDDKRFLNIFSDNEARLFFSNFILFVEGETELEIFGNRKLMSKFPDLKNIDVYATNELILKYVNPSYANTSIPYLIIYDADKLINIDFGINKLSFAGNIINITSLGQKYKRAYFGSLQFQISKYILLLKEYIQNKNLQFSTKKLFFQNFNYPLFINGLNNNLLIHEKYILLKTTIEETLINDNSFNLFKKWIYSEIKITDAKDIQKKIDGVEKVFQRQHNVEHAFKTLFGTDNTSNFLEVGFVHKIKRQYLLSEYKKLSIMFSKKEIVVAFRLLFNGKTDTLVSLENVNLNHLDPTFVQNIRDIKISMSYLQNLFRGKTSGWTTKFLNFAIDEIDRTKNQQTFEEAFKFNFEELHAIIVKTKI